MLSLFNDELMFLKITTYSKITCTGATTESSCAAESLSYQLPIKTTLI
jgi:hypothetical protein